MMLSQSIKSQMVFLGLNKTSKNNEVNLKHRGIPLVIQKTMAFLGLLLLAPLILLTALLIKLESRGPVFFTQVRIGENGRHFTCYKMRSMRLPSDPKYVDPATLSSDRDGVCQKFFNDPRVTKVGRIIRKLSIDELPQLLNVVKGDMVLIGPRPHLVSEYQQYDRQMLPRLFCKPGITGLWQVSGRADTTFEEQLMLDKTYVAEQSWWLDMKILLLTVPSVVTGRGAY